MKTKCCSCAGSSRRSQQRLQSEGIGQLELLIEALQTRSLDEVRRRALGQALAQQSLLFFRRGHFDRAQALLGRSLSVLRPLGQPAVLADPLVYLGIIAHLNSDLARSQTLMEEALGCAQAGGKEWFAANAIYNQGYLASLAGRYQEGYEKMSAALAMWRSIGDPRSIALGLNFLGPTLTRLGRHAEAQALLEESVELSTRANDRWGAGTAYRYLGLAKLAQGEFVEAQALLQQSLDLFAGFTVGWDVAQSLIYLGGAKLAAGEPREAMGTFREALREATEAQSVPLALDALMGLASLQAQAWELARCVAQHAASVVETRDRARRLCSALGARLPPELISARPRALADLVGEVLAGSEGIQAE